MIKPWMAAALVLVAFAARSAGPYDDPAHASVKLPDGVDVTSGSITLAVREPNQHRAQLLKLVAEEVTRTRDALQPGSIARVGGLEASVQVRAADDREVELFLPYTLAIERK
jgi:hypothetical protein